MSVNKSNNIDERTSLLRSAGSSSSQPQPFLAPLDSPAAGQGQQQHQQQYHASPISAVSSAGPTFSQAMYRIDPFTVEALNSADRRARHRFVSALLLGFLVWLSCGLVLGLVGGEGAGWWDHRDKHQVQWPGEVPRAPREDGKVGQCADFLKGLPTSAIAMPLVGKDPQRWTSVDVDPVTTEVLLTEIEEIDSGDGDVEISNANEGHPPNTFYRSKSYFSIELSELDGFYLLARGRFSVGPVTLLVEEPKHVSSASPSSGKPTVEVEVDARWNDKELLKSCKVCSISRNSTIPGHRGREYGVGIYSPEPQYSDPYHHVSFETIVRFPPSGLHALASLNVTGPSFSPVEMSLPGLSFDHIDVNTQNGPVLVRAGSALASRSARVHTSNGRIEGTYNVSDQLSLLSTNGPIRTLINLAAREDERDRDDGTRSVHVKTTNGGISLTYMPHPSGLVLQSRAETTNGDADVRHSTLFEGDFSVSALCREAGKEWDTSVVVYMLMLQVCALPLTKLSTSWGKGSVIASDRIRDPTGQNRTRKMHLTRDDHTLGIVEMEGEIAWEPSSPEMRKGRSVVSTSLGRASLDFDFS